MNIDPSTPRLGPSAPPQQADHQPIPQAPPNSPNALGLRMQPDGAALDAFSLQSQNGLQQQSYAAVPSVTQAQYWAPTPVQSFRYTTTTQAPAWAGPQPMQANEFSVQADKCCPSKKRKADESCQDGGGNQATGDYEKKARF